MSAERIGGQADLLSKKPHRAGTAANEEVAAEIERRLASSGYKSWSDVHEADAWEPVALRLAVTAPAAREIDLREREDPGDPATRIAAREVPFLAYAPDADVEAPLVWARSGSAEDYEALRKAGTDARGRIALVSAKGACRSDLAAAAERAGVAALLVSESPPEPPPSVQKGGGAPPDGVARGTLLKCFRRTGDPRRARELGADTLPRVPALAISGAAAAALRDEIGDVAGRKVRARVTVRGRTSRAKLRNVLATIPGTDPKAPPVLVMSAYDAWVFGAGDPGSAVAATLDAAHALARLYEDGWRPSRGVLFAFWDGRGPGMFGATAWLEAHLGQSGLPAATAIQVNPSAGPGPFTIRATPGLRALLAEVVGSASDPLAALPAGPLPLPRFAGDPAPFLALSAVPLVEIGSDPEPGVSGSLADTPAWLARKGDPGFVRAASLARIVALAVGALAGPRTLPLRYGEIYAYASRELRALQGRHPAATGWLPALVRPLFERLELFAAGASAWDAFAASGRGSGKMKAFADARALLALDALGAPGSFGRGSLLWGPTEAGGCRTVPFAAFDVAVRAGNRKVAKEEADALLGAFDRARDLLVAGEWAGSGHTRERPGGGTERVVRP